MGGILAALGLLGVAALFRRRGTARLRDSAPEPETEDTETAGGGSAGEGDAGGIFGSGGFLGAFMNFLSTESDPDEEPESEGAQQTKRRFSWPRCGKEFRLKGIKWRVNRVNREIVMVREVLKRDPLTVSRNLEKKTIHRDHHCEGAAVRNREGETTTDGLFLQGDMFRKSSGGKLWWIEEVKQIRYDVRPVRDDGKMRMFVTKPLDPSKPLDDPDGKPIVEFKQYDKWWEVPVLKQIGNLIGNVVGLVEGLFSEGGEEELGTVAGAVGTAATGNAALLQFGASVGAAAESGDTGDAVDATVSFLQSDADPDPDEEDEDDTSFAFSFF